MEDIHYGGMGWKRDLPDFRDFTPKTDQVKSLLSKSSTLKSLVKQQPSSADLRPWCSPVENQGQLGSCTANAGVGMLEYYEYRAHGKYLDGSRLFLYKASRDLLGWKGDQGAYLRTTMKAMVLFGVPPEQYWPYNISNFDAEPPAFCYAFAQSYQAVRYYRLDSPGSSPDKVLDNIKRYLAGGLPSMFGFSVYSSMPPVGDGKGEIPYPQPGDKQVGGHAVLAVGYDDKKKIGKDTGALLIRNSWGANWGEQGYGWLPYSYVLSGLAVDFWSLIQADFVDTDLFK